MYVFENNAPSILKLNEFWLLNQNLTVKTNVYLASRLAAAVIYGKIMRPISKLIVVINDQCGLQTSLNGVLSIS